MSQKEGTWEWKCEKSAWRKDASSGIQSWTPEIYMETEAKEQPDALASDAQNS